MLSSGKSGLVNEASNLIANQRLTDTIQEMSTREYQASRGSDVIPTHLPKLTQSRRSDTAPSGDANLNLKKKDEVSKSGDDDDADAELRELRHARMQQMRRQHDQAAIWRSKQHGQYREIDQDNFFNVVVREKGGSEQCCIHFYHKDFETCKVMDRRLSELAQTMLPVRFVKIDAERAPFLVDRLRVTTLPCVLLFKNDICVDRILGFSGCMSEDGLLDAELLRDRIEKSMKIDDTDSVNVA